MLSRSPSHLVGGGEVPKNKVLQAHVPLEYCDIMQYSYICLPPFRESNLNRMRLSMYLILVSSIESGV